MLAHSCCEEEVGPRVKPSAQTEDILRARQLQCLFVCLERAGREVGVCIWGWQEVFQLRWQMGFGACLQRVGAGPESPGGGEGVVCVVPGAARQALPEAQCAVWPPGPRAQAALRGNFQPSLTPPEGPARGRLRVFRALEIPTWPACPQHRLLQTFKSGCGPPWTLHCDSQLFGNKLKSVLTQLSPQLRCDNFYLQIWASFLKDSNNVTHTHTQYTLKHTGIFLTRDGDNGNIQLTGLL